MHAKIWRISKLQQKRIKYKSLEMGYLSFYQIISSIKMPEEWEEKQWLFRIFNRNLRTTISWKVFTTIFNGCSQITMDLLLIHQALPWTTFSHKCLCKTMKSKWLCYTLYFCSLILWDSEWIFKHFNFISLVRKGWEMSF